MNIEYFCPSCSASVPAENISTSGCSTVCPKCGKSNYNFLFASHTPDVDAVLSAKPPRGVTLKQNGDGVTLTYCLYRGYALSLSICIFLSIAFGFCIVLSRAYSFIKSFRLLEILYAISSMLMMGFPCFVLLAKYTVVLNQGHGTVFYGVWKLGRKWTFSYNRRSSVTIRNDPKIEGAASKHITIETDGMKFDFGHGIYEDTVKDFIAAALIRASATSAPLRENTNPVNPANPGLMRPPKEGNPVKKNKTILT